MIRTRQQTWQCVQAGAHTNTDDTLTWTSESNSACFHLFCYCEMSPSRCRLSHQVVLENMLNKKIKNVTKWSPKMRVDIGISGKAKYLAWVANINLFKLKEGRSYWNLLKLGSPKSEVLIVISLVAYTWNWSA